MKKFFTLLCCMALAAQYLMVSAQTTTMEIWKDGSVTTSYNTTDVDSVVFRTSSADGSVLIDGHTFIDLGLPSGVLWAETNIGAKTAADDGNYYAWGETFTKDAYGSNGGWDNYSLGSSYSDLTKYNSTDQLTTLENGDDAACENWGTRCHTPTAEEFEELMNSENCTWEWAEMTASDDSTIAGFKITSVKNGNSIFLPASGAYMRSDGSLSNHNESGDYWSCSLYSDDPSHARGLFFYKTGYKEIDYDVRFVGRTIRPVAK